MIHRLMIVMAFVCRTTNYSVSLLAIFCLRSKGNTFLLGEREERASNRRKRVCSFNHGGFRWNENHNSRCHSVANPQMPLSHTHRAREK